MPTRDEMLASIRAANQSQQPQPPTRDEMLAAIRSKTSEEPGMVSQGLDVGARVADAPGGFVRTGLAEVAGIGKAALQGQNPLTAPQVVTEEDLSHALEGKAPRSAELLERLGVPAGPTIPGGGMPMSPIPANLNLRDVGGFVGDVLTDPLTTLGRIMKPGTIAEKALNPLSHAAEAGGESMYKSGLKKADQAIAEKGAAPLSDLLMENNIAGTAKQVRSKAAELANNVKAERDVLHQTADASGVLIDPKEALADAKAEAERIAKVDPSQKDLSEKILARIKEYEDVGPVPVSQASEWKTNIYNSMPESAYDKLGRLKGPAQRIEKQMSGGLKTAIEGVSTPAAPDLGAQISKRNEQLQTLLSSRKPLKKMATAATSSNIVTPVDAMVGTATAMASHDPMTVAAAMGAKKLADLSKTTWFRTHGGRILKSIGEQNALDPVARRLLINKSPWEKAK